MKNFNYSLTYIAILALLFTSCSKEESDVSVLDNQDTFQMQFDVNLNDFNKQLNKDHLSDDPVECREAAPAYVLVALTDSNMDWVADKNPEADGAGVDDFIKVNIKDNNGSWETEFSNELGLPAGTYQLQYFIVYSADDMVLWVAPREGGAYAGSVDDPLPQEIVLGAGTKPYVEVDVLCFVPRVEDAFGYVFFDINAIAIENNYCIFVNFCDDGTGREYPANFQLDIWGDALDGSDVVIGGAMNSVSGEGNSFAATVLCVPLPPLGEGEVYYVRVTVLDAGAYDADASDFFEYTISQADIDAQLLEVPAYEHIRINCDGGGNGECDLNDPLADCDGDTILNGVDNCPSVSNLDQLDFDEDGLGDACDPDDDGDNIDDEDENQGCRLNPDPNCGVDPTDPCANLPAVCSIPQTDQDLEENCYFVYFDYDTQDNFIAINSAQTDIILENNINDTYGRVDTSVSGGDISISIDGALIDDLIIAYEVEVRPSNLDGSMSTTCWESSCDADVIAFDVSDRDQAPVGLSFSGFDYDYPYYIRVKAISCGSGSPQ